MFRKYLLVVTMMVFFLGFSIQPLFAQPVDLENHWAKEQITQWVNSGLAKGYPDGTFKPDATITRAEFITLVNKSFDINEKGQNNFIDVQATDWFAGEVAKASSYLSGYQDGSFKPNNQISRQEAAVIIANILNLSPSNNDAEGFLDAGSIPQWSKGSIGAVAAKGLMRGYPDQTFGPEKAISRAEAVSSLDRAMKGGMEEEVKDVTYNQAGTYGPASGTKTINGNVTISAENVILQNTTITGDLLLTEEVGEGDVTLKNVTVLGDTIIKGGGPNSVVLENCNLADVTISKEGVRVVATGNTTVTLVTLESGATLVEVSVTGEGFEKVTLSETIPAGAKVTLEGDFSQVTVDAGVEIEIVEGTVEKLTINEAAKITGEGKITQADINVSGASISQKPASYTVAPQVSTSVAGSSITNNTSQPSTTTTSSSSGGGGGSGGSGGGSPATGPPESFEFEIRPGSVEFELMNIQDGSGNPINLDLLTLDGNSIVEFKYTDQIFEELHTMSTFNFSFLGIDASTLQSSLDFSDIYDYWMGQAFIEGFDEIHSFDVTLSGTYDGQVFSEVKIEAIEFTNKAAIGAFISNSLRGALDSLIVQANDLKSATPEGVLPGQAPASAHSDFETEIASAVTLSENMGASIQQLFGGIQDLEQAMQSFSNEIVSETISVFSVNPNHVTAGAETPVTVVVISTFIANDSEVTVTLHSGTPAGDSVGTATGTINDNTATVNFTVQDTVAVGQYYFVANVGSTISDGVLLSVGPSSVNSSVSAATSPVSPLVNGTFTFEVSLRDAQNQPISGLGIDEFNYPGMITHSGSGFLNIVAVNEDGDTGDYTVSAAYDTAETIDIDIAVLYTNIGTIENVVVSTGF